MPLGAEEKGRRAKQILEDEVFLEVIDSARTHILTQWNLTDFDQVEARESFYYQGRALDENTTRLASIGIRLESKPGAD